jgi:lysophospholipase L1-like esterase
MELDMLPLIFRRAVGCGLVMATGGTACAFPPLAARRIPPRTSESCTACVELQPVTQTKEPADQHDLRRAALDQPMRGPGIRFVPQARPDAEGATEPPFRLGTMELSSLGAQAVLSFQAGKQPSLPQGTTVLHIGDSFAGALGIPLRQELAQHGVKTALHFQTASYIPTWAHHKKLPLYLLQHRPDLVVITLGGNELAIDNPAQRAGTIRRLVKKLGDRPCVWVVPPLWKEENGLTRVIRESCLPCRFMDTNALIRDMPRADGVHPTQEARGDWAKLVVAWLAGQRDPTASRPWELREQ